MKRTSFENLYDEYESQRRDELRFILEDTNPRIPYTPQQKENNTMNNLTFISFVDVLNNKHVVLISNIISIQQHREKVNHAYQYHVYFSSGVHVLVFPATYKLLLKTIEKECTVINCITDKI